LRILFSLCFFLFSQISHAQGFPFSVSTCTKPSNIQSASNSSADILLQSFSSICKGPLHVSSGFNCIAEQLKGFFVKGLGGDMELALKIEATEMKWLLN